MRFSNAPTPGADLLPPDQRTVSADDEGVPVGLPAGFLLGSYIIDQTIGRGGSGIVYAAHHAPLADGRANVDFAPGARVAIKVLRDEYAMSPVAVTRFMREAQAVNRIGHPNIVTIIDFAETDPAHPYYVMELLEGVDLREFLNQHGRFSPRETLELLGPLCEAVAAAHAAGIVHRDIKASNVMVSERDGQRSVKLLDFGIAKMLDADAVGQGLTEPGTRLGTTGHMPPEQIRGERTDERADIYAVGVLMYQLLTGEPPFHAEHPRQIALLHLQAPAPRPSAIAPVPSELDTVVLRCLEKRPDRRYQTVAALHGAFREAVGNAVEPRAQSSQAVAFYLEVSTGCDDEQIDDAVLDDLLDVLELAQQTLLAHGFVFPLYTSNALLAVRPIAPGSDVDEERREALALAAELTDRLAARARAHVAVLPALSMTLGEALLQSSDAGCEIVGGALLDLASWTAQNRL